MVTENNAMDHVCYPDQQIMCLCTNSYAKTQTDTSQAASYCFKNCELCITHLSNVMLNYVQTCVWYTCSCALTCIDALYTSQIVFVACDYGVWLLASITLSMYKSVVCTNSQLIFHIIEFHSYQLWSLMVMAVICIRVLVHPVLCAVVGSGTVCTNL